MPIWTSSPIKVIDQETFHRIDHQVTGLAFDIHNEFGRYLDEKLYQAELARRCRRAGLDVLHDPELEMTVSLDGFIKKYFADVLINQGAIVETKAESALTPAHTGQTLNYLFLCGLHHATLLNFRSERVQHQFVSTRLTLADRLRYDFDLADWKPLTPQCEQLKHHLNRCLAEWGAFLDPILFRDALTHFLGGEERLVRRIPVLSEGEIIGTQEMRLMTNDVAFAVTAATHHPFAILDHQQRFLTHTPLKALQWINLNHHKIELRTVTRK